MLLLQFLVVYTIQDINLDVLKQLKEVKLLWILTVISRLIIGSFCHFSHLGTITVGSVVANARQYIHNIDVYIFPNTAQDPASQMTSYINSLKADGVLTNNMVWMDIEGSQYWSTSCSSNQQWLATAISTVQNLYSGCGLPSCVGIYTGSSQWTPIMCNTAEFSSHPLWYAHYDNNPSFSGYFLSFCWSNSSHSPFHCEKQTLYLLEVGHNQISNSTKEQPTSVVLQLTRIIINLIK